MHPLQPLVPLATAPSATCGRVDPLPKQRTVIGVQRARRSGLRRRPDVPVFVDAGLLGGFRAVGTTEFNGSSIPRHTGCLCRCGLA